MVTQYFWPENFNINSLVQSIEQRGHQVDVLTGKPNYPAGEIYLGYNALGCDFETWKGVNVYRIPIIARGEKSGFRLALNYLSFVVSGLVLAPWMLRGKQYDAIFVYAPSPIFQAIPASFVGWIKKCPVALWVQDLWPESAQATGYVRSPWVLKLLWQFVRFVYSHTDLLMVQSRGFINSVAALAPDKPIAYYPNSVEPMFYDPLPMDLPEIPGLAGTFSILFAGNVGSGQAVEVIIDAAEKLRGNFDIQFVVLGSGSRWEWMREQVQVRGLINVHLAGRYPVETMPGLMRQASALLVTLADEPIFAATIPSKVQAYMAVGRPIIASLNGEGAKLVCEAHAGFAVPAQNSDALVDAVLRLYRMSANERKTMGENGRAYYKEHFDHEVLVGELVEQLSRMAQSFGDKQ